MAVHYIRNTAGTLGTGVRPIVLGSPVWMNASYWVRSPCPFCRAPIGTIPEFAREYISLLFVPLFPLSLSMVIACHKCHRVFRSHLPFDEWEGVTENLRAYGEGVHCTWKFSAFVSLVGACAGWFGLPAIPITISYPVLGAIFGWYLLGVSLMCLLDEIDFFPPIALLVGVGTGVGLGWLLSAYPLPVDPEYVPYVGAVAGMGAFSCLLLSLAWKPPFFVVD